MISKIRTQFEKLYQVLNIEAIHVLFLRLNRPPQEIFTLKGLLSLGEVKRAERFKFAIDRQRYIARQGLLRILLSECTGFDIKNLIIKQEKNGKPYLFGQNENTAVHFNLSNSNNIAAYAFSKMKDIGIDIEKIRPIPDMMDIAANNFTEKENVLIAQCDTHSRSDMFYRIWTRKEAVLKAQGVGLLVPLDSVDVSMSIDQKGPTQVNISGENQSAEIWVNEIKCASGYRAALAAKRAFKNITVTDCQTA